MDRSIHEENSLTTSKLLGGLGAGLAGTTLLNSQQDPPRDQQWVPAIDELKTVMEFEAVAYAKLPRESYTYTIYGSEGEFTLRRNREGLGWGKHSVGWSWCRAASWTSARPRPPLRCSTRP